MEDLEERSSKRRKLRQGQLAEHGEITDVDQLSKLLRFRQSASLDTKIAINRFKDFLSGIAKIESLAAKSRSLQLLRQYCDNQTASTRDDPDFPDLISTWSFAAQSNNDSICSAIPAALAQFYKTISGVLEFREFGLSLGHTLLKREQVRLLDRGLSASRTKEHLISPCLRLLTEVISFDGGTLANRAFGQRDTLFRRFDVLLDQKNTENDNDRRKPSVRRMALRLTIANLKFLDPTARVEFVMQGRTLRTCLNGTPLDGDDIVVDLLKSIDTGILEDKDIPRITRSRILNRDNLKALSLLYDYQPDRANPDSSTRVRDAVHQLLLKICTTRKGILLAQNGWYPVGCETKLETISDSDYIDVGLDSPIYNDEYYQNIPVKNNTLSSFAQDLKPQDDTLQSALLLQILRSAPELVADYVSKSTKLDVPSSDDSRWRSQFAFLYSVSQLPIPKEFGWQNDALPGPPPVSIVIESIIPRPFDRTILSRYLTSNEEILVLSAARLLVVALGKLQSILNLYEQKTISSAWQQNADRLVEATLHRIPKLQEIVNSLQRTGKDSETIRLALSECLLACHNVVPEATTGSKFDIGQVLSDELSRFELQNDGTETEKMFQEQVNYFVKIARSSQATRWWHKLDSETLSLFSRLFRFAVTRARDEVASDMLQTLESVSISTGVMSADAAFTALRLSIMNSETFRAVDEVWLMLDNAIHRAVQQPVKYLDQIEAIQQAVSDKKPLSLLTAAVAEQWELILKRYESQIDVIKNISEWIARFYSALESAGENFRVIQHLRDNMLPVAKETSKEISQKAIQRVGKHSLTVEPTGHAEEQSDEPKSQRVKQLPGLNDILVAPATLPNSLEGLNRWDDKTDIESAIQSGKLTKLLQCTASPEDEIRRQAIQYLHNLMRIVDQSTYNEKIQVHLLLGELIQTIRQQDPGTALPSVAAGLATRLLQIVSDPTHHMYAKANKFLLRSPVWDLRKLISYWMRETLFQDPESDSGGAWVDEVEWFLQFLINGLRTSSDMELYRRSGIFEKVLVIYTKPALLWTTRKLILSLIWRGVCADGADTLITRVGIMNWLHVVGSQDKEHHDIIEQLSKEILSACDEKRINSWREDLPALRRNT